MLHCTDSVATGPDAKAPWLERKTVYLERLRHADGSAALITVADKLHNITATLRDVRAHGPQTLARFAEPARLLWYYRSVAEALAPHAGSAPVAELRAAITELEDLVA